MLKIRKHLLSYPNRYNNLNLLLAICLFQKLILLIYFVKINPGVLPYNDITFYVNPDTVSFSPYFYWRKAIGFQNTNTFLALSFAFIFSTSVFLTYCKIVLKYQFNEQMLLFLIFALILNPYYNLYFLKNSADFLAMNLIILFCVFWYQKRPFFMAFLGLLIVLCKPFLLLLIGYITQSHLKLNKVGFLVIILGVLSVMLFFDYSDVPGALLGVISKLYTEPFEFVKSYLARVLSFFTQREGNRLTTFDDLVVRIDLAFVLLSFVLLSIAFYILKIVYDHDKYLFCVFIFSIGFICLYAAHLRYAFLFYLIVFHLRVIKDKF